MEKQQKSTISRGLIPLYYSTTSGMSKLLANRFQSKIQEAGFVAPVMNIGDIDTEQFILFEGPVIMFLSTYGNGDSPQDGQSFLDWIEKLKQQVRLKNISFAILGLGNSTFQNFCGHAKRINSALLKHQSEIILQTKFCDANKQSQLADKVFGPWSEELLKILTQKYPMKQISLENLTSGLNYQISNKSIDWQAEQVLSKYNLNKQFSTFIKSPKTEVIHIKELRKDVESGRSTLWLRIKKPDNVRLWPGCNINIYPQNIVEENMEQQNLFIEFKGKNKTTKLPFPPLSLSQLKKLVNLRQKGSNRLVKNAILFSKQSIELKDKYRQLVLQDKIQNLTCERIISELKPSYEFYADLGVNLARTYTLSSWIQNDNYFDLCVSLVQKGLTSTYLQSVPRNLRINTFESRFNVPQNHPLIMIANGSGIAPFRSIVQYVAQLPAAKRIPLRLYFGIQSIDTDYYFRQDFQQYQKQGILEIRLAQSRKDPNQKLYVQQLVEQDKQFVRQHLFRKQGRIFVCGGKEMSKGVNAAIFKAITLECKFPYKGFTISNDLKSKSIIVEEVFG